MKESKMWNYFGMHSKEQRMAQCKLCPAILSYKTSITNLKSHLKRKHYKFFREMNSDRTQPILPPASPSPKMATNDSEEDSDDETANPMWSFFEKEKGGRARCVVCCKVVQASVHEFRRHLRRQHPKLLTEVNESDKDDQEGEMYTEILYLEEPSTKEETPKSASRGTNSKSSQIKFKPKDSLKVRKRRSSDEEDYDRRRRYHSEKANKKTSNDEEIESFGTYVVCLLKKLPRTVSMKVQRDIINLIMNANLNEEEEERLPNIIFDGNIKRGDESAYFVVTNKENDVSSEKKLDPNSSGDTALENPASSFDNNEEKND